MNTLTVPGVPPGEEQTLIGRALIALHRSSGIAGEIFGGSAGPTPGEECDRQIRLKWAGAHYDYCVAANKLDRFANIGAIKARLATLPKPGLCVLPRVSTEMAAMCREHDLQFIDTCGNAFLHAEGLFVLIQGLRAEKNRQYAALPTEHPRTSTPAMLKVVFALLCHPDLIGAPYREISRTAKVALGTVGGVFEDLSQRRLILAPKNGKPAKFIEHKRLIDEWAINYPVRLRPKLNAKRFSAADPNWWKAIDVLRYEGQWGGEVAAEKLTGYLRAQAVTIYLSPENLSQNLLRLVTQNKLRADPSGNIEILERFWAVESNADTSDTVPPLLAYADLMTTTDSRNHETGKILYQELINHAKSAG